MTTINSLYSSNLKATADYAVSNTEVTDQEKKDADQAGRVAVVSSEDLVNISPQAIEKLNAEMTTDADQQGEPSPGMTPPLPTGPAAAGSDADDSTTAAAFSDADADDAGTGKTDGTQKSAGSGGGSSSGSGTDKRIAELQEQIKVLLQDIARLSQKAREDENAAAMLQAKQSELGALQAELMQLMSEQLQSAG